MSSALDDVRDACRLLRDQGRESLASHIEGRLDEPETAAMLCRIALGTSSVVLAPMSPMERGQVLVDTIAIRGNLYTAEHVLCVVADAEENEREVEAARRCGLEPEPFDGKFSFDGLFSRDVAQSVHAVLPGDGAVVMMPEDAARRLGFKGELPGSGPVVIHGGIASRLALEESDEGA